MHEPAPADIAATQAFIDGSNGVTMAPPNPTPQPAPAPQQEQAPVQQPAPQAAPADPFAAYTAQAPTEPAAPTQAPVQPTELIAPQPQQQPQPAQAPVQQPQPQMNADEAFNQYLDSVIGGNANQPAQAPDLDSIDQNDPAAIKQFFEDWGKSIKEQAIAEVQKENALVTAERKAWDSAFDKYPTLRNNPELRDTVHNIRMGSFQNGVAITPTQAAEKLLSAINARYQAGVADTKVVTTIQDAQPQGGDNVQVIPTEGNREQVLESFQTGGESALAAYLDSQIKSGKL